MFIIRRAKIEDTNTLLKLAKMVHFINLPADKEIIADKIIQSRRCFIEAAELGDDASAKGVRTRAASGEGLARVISRSHLFMFVMEEVETGGVIGTSQIVSKMGGPGHPNLVFQLEKRHKFSESLQTGTTQMVAKLYLDESSPSEIGGLILQPAFRGHRRKLGRFLSVVRFHFLGLHRALFSDRIVAEMMAPITADGRNTLWEYLGRRFINLSYEEADRFCQHSKEFMTSLLPRDPIYLSLLPPEARAVVGQVGPETVPARKMLERLGFEYHDRIDPFDGGPHLEATTDDVTLVRATSRRRLGEPEKAAACPDQAIVSVLDPDGEFRAVETACKLPTGRGTSIRIPANIMKQLGVEPKASVGVTVLPTGRPAPSSRVNGAARGAGKSGGKKATSKPRKKKTARKGRG